MKKDKPVYRTFADIIIRVVVVMWISSVVELLISVSGVNPDFLQFFQPVNWLLAGALMVFASLYVLAYLFWKKATAHDDTGL
ncbi:MAG: hypothetical protein IPH12_21665 [Saprospirales bacterium]|nr:hypothetical protein [Saprospirales bacterium]MBK8920558.1 hypothetical protein [Saprospirales bacterium]